MSQGKQTVQCPHPRCGKITSYAHASGQTTNEGSAYFVDCEYCSKPIKIPISGKNGMLLDQTPVALKSTRN